MYSYKGLLDQLERKWIGRSELTSLVGMSSRTVAKIAKGEKISDGVLRRIAACLSCEPGDLCREISDDPLLRALRDGKEMRLSGGLYRELQVQMTYNSNRIDGGCLDEEQTRLIFETNILSSGNGIDVDDVLETVHHFRAVDHIIDNAESPLTEDFVKHIHFMLKQNTSASSHEWFGVGEYKRYDNFADGSPTAAPRNVPALMEELIGGYEAKKDVGLEDIAGFHAEFEKIHPFQAGNGTVGRLVMLKECLRHGVAPFFIGAEDRAAYFRGISEWDADKSLLLSVCRSSQKAFGKLDGENGA